MFTEDVGYHRFTNLMFDYFKQVQNDEFLVAWLDKDDYLLLGIRRDGTLTSSTFDFKKVEQADLIVFAGYEVFMQELQKKLGMAIILVTHDLGVIADMCDEIIVMYGGRVCERGNAEDIFYNPYQRFEKLDCQLELRDRNTNRI